MKNPAASSGVSIPKPTANRSAPRGGELDPERLNAEEFSDLKSQIVTRKMSWLSLRSTRPAFARSLSLRGGEADEAISWHTQPPCHPRRRAATLATQSPDCGKFSPQPQPVKHPQSKCTCGLQGNEDVGWVEAVKADTHRQRTLDGYRYAQPILRLLAPRHCEEAKPTKQSRGTGNRRVIRGGALVLETFCLAT